MSDLSMPKMVGELFIGKAKVEIPAGGSGIIYDKDMREIVAHRPYPTGMGIGQFHYCTCVWDPMKRRWLIMACEAN